MSRREWDDLLGAHNKCEAVIRTLTGTNWAGAHACIVLVGEVDQVIAHLWNKAESAFNPEAAAKSAEPPQETLSEPSTGEDVGSGENASQGKEGA